MGGIVIPKFHEIKNKLFDQRDSACYTVVAAVFPGNVVVASRLRCAPVSVFQGWNIRVQGVVLWLSPAGRSSRPRTSPWPWSRGTSCRSIRPLTRRRPSRPSGAGSRGVVFSDGKYNNRPRQGQVYPAPYGWVPMDPTARHLRRTKATAAILRWNGSGWAARTTGASLSTGTGARGSSHRRRTCAPTRSTTSAARPQLGWRQRYFDQLDCDFQWQLLPTGQGCEG